MGKARMQSKATGQTEHLYGETRYAARRWTRKRRVILKAGAGTARREAFCKVCNNGRGCVGVR